MRGEHLVVLFGRKQMLVRPGELQPEDQCLDAAGDEEGEGSDDIAKTDLFVVDGREPAGDAGLGLSQLFQP
jgi:hypothetical protein